MDTTPNSTQLLDMVLGHNSSSVNTILVREVVDTEAQDLRNTPHRLLSKWTVTRANNHSGDFGAEASIGYTFS